MIGGGSLSPPRSSDRVRGEDGIGDHVRSDLERLVMNGLTGGSGAKSDRGELRLDQELACDASAVRQVERSDYANALLKSQMRTFSPGGCVGSRLFEFWEERISERSLYPITSCAARRIRPEER